VNPADDAGRDDFGLPPVDIEIPDDARELDRDVQAYRRELRAQRRRQLLRRLSGPAGRDGMLLPLLSGCLILALVAGTLLVLFSADQTNQPGSQPAVRPGASGQSTGLPSFGPSATVGQVNGQLPAGSLLVAGNTVPLGALGPVVLALVPSGCRCAGPIRQLTGQAAASRLTIYLVATPPVMRELARLARRAGAAATGVIAEDPNGTLDRVYRPAGLTAVLVNASGSVTQIARGLRPGLRLQPALRQLALTGAR
jgi:hypothetical protein